MIYEIMNKNVIVAKWDSTNDETIIIDRKVSPLYVLRTNDTRSWLASRAIDRHRTHSRLLKKAIRLQEKDDVSTVIAVHGATITDTYWIREEGSNDKYEDLVFTDRYFATLALRGTSDSFNNVSRAKNKLTAELTNIGSYEKCWRLENGKWWMQKKASQAELFSELFAYHFGKKLGFDMAVYEKGYDGSFIKTLDFTDSGRMCFEPMFSLVGDDEDYEKSYETLKSISDDLVKPFVQMIFLDTLILNPDRHTFNYGLLRDPDDGRIIKMAPNFDNNMSLIRRGYPKNIKRSPDTMIELFNRFVHAHPYIKEFLPQVREDEVRECVRALGMKVKTDYVIQFIMNGYYQIV